jgi:hypothetical protein
LCGLDIVKLTIPYSHSIAFYPEVLRVPFGGVADFGHHFIPSNSADISSHNITGIPGL